jgi:hypothetical protein
MELEIGLERFKTEALRILAEAETRNKLPLRSKREFPPELHPWDCNCMRCISLRV